MVVVQYNDIGNVRLLFDKYWRTMTDDIAYKIQHALSVWTSTVPNHFLQIHLLHDLASLFSANGLSLEYYDLPIPPDGYENSLGNKLIAKELCYDSLHLESQAKLMCESLNDDQRLVYDKAIHSVSYGQPCFYFVSGHGGTGKTFFYFMEFYHFQDKIRR